MPLSKLKNAISRLSPKKRKAEKAREELRANAEKALRMKQESGTATHIPPHRTSHEGMHQTHQDPASQVRSRQADFNQDEGTRRRLPDG